MDIYIGEMTQLWDCMSFHPCMHWPGHFVELRDGVDDGLASEKSNDGVDHVCDASSKGDIGDAGLQVVNWNGEVELDEGRWHGSKMWCSKRWCRDKKLLEVWEHNKIIMSTD